MSYVQYASIHTTPTLRLQRTIVLPSLIGLTLVVCLIITLLSTHAPQDNRQQAATTSSYPGSLKILGAKTAGYYPDYLDRAEQYAYNHGITG